MSSRRRAASAGSRARRRRITEGLRCRPRRADFIDIDALREALEVVRAHSASFSLDDRIAPTPSYLPDPFERRPDQADRTISERWEVQNKARLQNS